MSEEESKKQADQQKLLNDYLSAMERKIQGNRDDYNSLHVESEKARAAYAETLTKEQRAKFKDIVDNAEPATFRKQVEASLDKEVFVSTQEPAVYSAADARRDDEARIKEVVAEKVPYRVADAKRDDEARLKEQVAENKPEPELKTLSPAALNQLVSNLQKLDDKVAKNDVAVVQELYGDVKLSDEQQKNKDNLFLSGKGKEDVFRLYAEKMKEKGGKLSEQDIEEIKPKAAEIVSNNLVVDHKDKFDDVAPVNPSQLNADRQLIAQQQSTQDVATR